jgi:hypothetical protein
LLVLLVAALGAVDAWADETETPMVSFRGFGTLGVVHSSEDRADFTGAIFKARGAGFNGSWSTDVDSLIGAQLTAAPMPKLSAVLQVISEQDYANSWRPHVEWANLKYDVTPEWSIRVGRTLLPILMVADTAKVGFAFPWARPPIELYGLDPVTSSDGIDVSWRTTLDGGTNTLQATAGRWDSKYPSPNGISTSQTRGLVSLVDTYERGYLTLRVQYGRARISVPELVPLFEGFRQFGPEGAAIASRYNATDMLVQFSGVGASYDPGKWFAMGEWNQFLGQSFLGRKSGWYVSGGVRLGKFTPYATFARATADNLHDPGLDVSTLPPELAEAAIGLNAGLNATLSQKSVQHTVSLGARWDFAHNAALKVQFDRSRIGAGSTGTLENIQPDRPLGGKFNLFSASLNFVF